MPIIGGAKCIVAHPAKMESIGIAVSSPSGVRGGVPNAVAFCCRPIVCSQNASAWLQRCWFFGQHCNEWQNESQFKLRSNLVSAGNLRHIG